MPAGAPAAANSSAIARPPEIGVSGDGLSTTAFPSASAGAITRMPSTSGKFHGVITPTTPTGTRSARDEPARVAGLQDLPDRPGSQGRGLDELACCRADLVVGLAADAASLAHDELAERRRGFCSAAATRGAGRPVRRRCARPTPAAPRPRSRLRRRRRLPLPDPATAKISPVALSRTSMLPPSAGGWNLPVDEYVDLLDPGLWSLRMAMPRGSIVQARQRDDSGKRFPKRRQCS